MFKEKFEKVKIKVKEVWNKYQDEIVLGGVLIVSAVGGIIYGHDMGYSKGYAKGYEESVVRGYDLGRAEAFCEMAQIIGGEPVALTGCASNIASGLIKTAIELNGNPDAPEEIMSITDDNISDYVAGIIIGRKDKNNGSEVQAQ